MLVRGVESAACDEAADEAAPSDLQTVHRLQGTVRAADEAGGEDELVR